MGEALGLLCDYSRLSTRPRPYRLPTKDLPNSLSKYFFLGGSGQTQAPVECPILTSKLTVNLTSLWEEGGPQVTQQLVKSSATSSKLTVNLSSLWEEGGPQTTQQLVKSSLTISDSLAATLTTPVFHMEPRAMQAPVECPAIGCTVATGSLAVPLLPPRVAASPQAAQGSI